MRYLRDTFLDVLSYMRQYKSRTLMTMFGIVWGTMTVILLLSFGVGVRKMLSKSMHGIGEGIAIVWPNATSIPFAGYGRDRRIRLTDADIEYLRTEVRDIERISPEFSRWGTAIRLGDKVNKPNITGIIPEYGVMRNIWPEQGGRWLNDLDIEKRRRVVFIGNRLRDFLFGANADAIGRYVYVGDIPFLVVGVMKEKIQDSSYNQRDRDRAFIPMTTFKSIFGAHYVDNLVYQINDPRLSERVQTQVYAALAKKFIFDPKDKETLNIWDTTEFDEFIFYFNIGFNGFMGLIGIITLVVGGIGLANIMYVVVQERTSEIGIRRAVGAKRRVILRGFVAESFIIIGFSALFGLLLAVIIIAVVASFPTQEYIGVPELNLQVAIVTALVLSTIGFLAGYFPARRASRLDVVDCLRY
ncbi:ABC transporter permease [candidate division KSB1 bacterium]|nr:ABC transporter permease [candidate division KSB1 bacterium]RQW11366.1 MAG: FtsX-like permease family protein [candidate division KSB1 bacterium]